VVFLYTEPTPDQTNQLHSVNVLDDVAAMYLCLVMVLRDYFVRNESERLRKSFVSGKDCAYCLVSGKDCTSGSYSEMMPAQAVHIRMLVTLCHDE
jgi:hypothetical protein